MSTTDTIRAAFVAAKAKMIRTGDGWTDFEMFEAGHKAATEAAKATGTAGELTEHEVDFLLLVLQNPGAKLRGLLIPDNRWAAPENFGLVKCTGSWKWEPTDKLLGILRNRLLNAEAARQPAPAFPVKTWQERLKEGGWEDYTAMLAEIAELRAALAATAAPVLSDEQITRIIREVAELPDRDSPVDQPDMMLVSAEELRTIIAATNRSQP